MLQIGCELIVAIELIVPRSRIDFNHKTNVERNENICSLASHFRQVIGAERRQS